MVCANPPTFFMIVLGPTFSVLLICPASGAGSGCVPSVRCGRWFFFSPQRRRLIFSLMKRVPALPVAFRAAVTPNSRLSALFLFLSVAVPRWPLFFTGTCVGFMLVDRALARDCLSPGTHPGAPQPSLTLSKKFSLIPLWLFPLGRRFFSHFFTLCAFH